MLLYSPCLNGIVPFLFPCRWFVRWFAQFLISHVHAYIALYNFNWRLSCKSRFLWWGTWARGLVLWGSPSVRVPWASVAEIDWTWASLSTMLPCCILQPLSSYMWSFSPQPFLNLGTLLSSFYFILSEFCSSNACPTITQEKSKNTHMKIFHYSSIPHF